MFSTFHDLEIRFGAVAYHYLQEIEKAARIASNPSLDPEIRLERAVRAQDADQLQGAA
jgi:hypothetical protein